MQQKQNIRQASLVLVCVIKINLQVKINIDYYYLFSVLLTIGQYIILLRKGLEADKSRNKTVIKTDVLTNLESSLGLIVSAARRL